MTYKLIMREGDCNNVDEERIPRRLAHVMNGNLN
jgi:hypothetical protein